MPPEPTLGRVDDATRRRRREAGQSLAYLARAKE